MTKLSHVLFRVPGIWSVLNKFYLYICTHMCTDCVCSYSIPYGAWGQLHSVDLSLCPWGISKVHGLPFPLCTCPSSLGEALGREGPCGALCHWVPVLWLWRSDLSHLWPCSQVYVLLMRSLGNSLASVSYNVPWKVWIWGLNCLLSLGLVTIKYVCISWAPAGCWLWFWLLTRVGEKDYSCPEETHIRAGITWKGN